jgi:polyisoprenoid-binding protein YceI
MTTGFRRAQRTRNFRTPDRSVTAGAGAAAFAVGLLLVAASPASSAPAVLTLDPNDAQVRFEVDSTLHRVHGTVRLVSGEVHFDTDGGDATGRVELDARSADTGSSMRDGVLHDSLLESGRYPQVVFLPDRVDVVRRDGAHAVVRIGGHVEIHGDVHPLAIDARVSLDGDRAEVSGGFPIPYVAWGMEDPGNFVLSVDDVVEVAFVAKGRLAPDTP